MVYSDRAPVVTPDWARAAAEGSGSGAGAGGGGSFVSCADTAQHRTASYRNASTAPQLI